MPFSDLTTIGVNVMERYRNPEVVFDENIGKKTTLATDEKKGIEDAAEIHTENSDYKFCKNMYFAFIDILGFKKEFDDNRENDPETFSKKFSMVFNYFFGLMDAAKFMNGENCYAGQTSDSLYFYTDRADFLLEFIKIFSHFNAYAMMQDVFFRGGIAKGDLFKKKNYQFYGDCVIRAYLLESEIAKNPVVYIDQNTYNDLKKEIKFDPDLFREDNSHARYYMYPFTGLSIDIKEYIAETFLVEEYSRQTIEENIKKNKNQFEYDARNFGKYVFLEEKLSNK